MQVVTAVVPRADAYPELAVEGVRARRVAGRVCVVVALDVLRPDWMSAHAALSHVLPVLGAGALAALRASPTCPPFARLFLRDCARRTARRASARSRMFLDRDLVRTHARTAVLLLVARFERRVELVADHGLRRSHRAGEWDAVIDAATRGPRARRRRGARCSPALDRLEALLVVARLRGGARRTATTLPDAPHRGGRHHEAARCVVALLLALRARRARAADVPYLSGRVVDDAEILKPATRDGARGEAQGARGRAPPTRSSC